MTPASAPAWSVRRWFNAPDALSLADLRGSVVVLHAFQMLCPGCVTHSLPQMQRLHGEFADAPLTIVGLHTVFEHHAAMGDVSLEAFLHEYRIQHPVGVDRPHADGGPIPTTMRAYAMRGTPTTILIDAEGRLRQHWFGAVPDLSLGRAVGELLAQTTRGEAAVAPPRIADASCASGACST